MIHKDSLLDAYLTLGGSPSMHLAMLLVSIFILRQPDEIEDDYMRDRLSYLYWWSVAVHSISFIIQ